MIGTVVADKYRIVRRVGAGGMGTVYEALQTTTGRVVALKLLSSRDLCADDQSVSDLSDSLRAQQEEIFARFLREAHATGRIRSEHVVQIVDAGEDATLERPYIAMELLDGETLQAVCKRIGAIAPSTALRIAAQACRGLVDAHEAGVIHRDIKIANLLLSRRGDGEVIVKVLDFGIAKVRMDQLQSAHEAGLTRTGSMLGSPHYMSPEQAKGLKTIDHRADLWSLGVVLYRMLCGTTPFDTTSLGQVVLAICTEEPTPVRQRAPWVSPAVAAIVERALRKRPEERFASAKDMLDALMAQLPSGARLREDMIVGLSDSERSLLSAAQGAEAARVAEAETRMEFRRDAAAEPQRRSPRRGILLVGALLATALGGWYALRSSHLPGLSQGVVSVESQDPAPSQPGAPAVDPTQEPQAATAPVPERVAPAASQSAAAPSERAVELVIDPPQAAVLLDGRPAPVESGKIAVRGPLGSVHEITLRLGKSTRKLNVVITERGPLPERAELTASAASAPHARQGASRPPPREPPPRTPTAGEPPKPPAETSKPPDRVGATNSFE